MAKNTNRNIDDEESVAFDTAGANIINVNLKDESEQAFLEYAMAVIYSRAIPDSRDGLKPVHRRILFGMQDMGLRPDHAHVKSAKVVGAVMANLHAHGDSSIYEALVRLTQDFSLNTPLISGHGNFGSVNGDSAAAMRYTECRLDPQGMLMVGELDEGTVDFMPNYDGSIQEPTVLPAAFPNLLVNGSSGIAVGMATNMIAHSLKETVEACRLLIRKPKATLDEIMEIIPGPDLPTGGSILGLDQVRLAYETGKGQVRIRAKAEVEPLEGSRGRMAIVVTELPYMIGTEKIIEKIKEEVAKKRLIGVADVKDLSGRKDGLRLVIECKTGINPQALLNDLYRLTPLETSFSISNLALVDGQPQTLGLKPLLEVFLNHRYEVVTRRTQFRLDKAEARKHIVDGLLIALNAIDEVVKTIRASKDTAVAKEALMKKFKLSEIQTTHILEMPLRRLVSLEVESLKKELADLLVAIAGFKKILGDDKELRKVVDKELEAVVDKFGVPRRTQLMQGDLKEIVAATSEAPVEINDDPCKIILSSTGLLARSAAASEESNAGRKKSGRAKHDAIHAVIDSTARGQILVVTNKGRAFKYDVLSIPALAEASGTLSLKGGMPAREVASMVSGEIVVGIAPMGKTEAYGLALGTKNGLVKVVKPDWPLRSEEFEVISLEKGDEVVGAAWLPDDKADLVFIASDSSLLYYPASKVRPQGRSGGGMAGIKVEGAVKVVGFNATVMSEEPSVVTYTGASAKVTPLASYPSKGRGTGGVRSHKFLKGEDKLVAGWIYPLPVGSTERGESVDLPDEDVRRDSAGTSVVGLGVVGKYLEK
jgi:DNA gyrase subunit A